MSDTQVRTAPSDDVISAGAAPRPLLDQWAKAGMAVFREQIWLISVVLGFIALGMAVGRWQGQVIALNLYSEVMTPLYIVFAMIGVTTRAVSIFRRHRPARPIAFLISDVKAFYLAPHRFLRPLPALILIPPLISVVSSIKRLIPILQPYRWDQRFAEFDRILHGGVHPWELLQTVLAHPAITIAISELYGAPWLIAVVVMQFWLTFTANPDRPRLLLTYVLAWILLGNLAAIAWSSAGPVYYDQFVAGANPYHGLATYLARVNEWIPISALETQSFLWSMYEAGDLRPGTGISAMPSMHLSMATLLFLCARRLGRRLAICALCYLIFLQVGSVHLGWHYAIDGYAGIAGTLSIWWILGRVAPGSGPGRIPAAKVSNREVLL